MLQTPIERKRRKRVTYQPFIVKDETKRNIIVFLVSLFSPLAAFNWLRGLTVQMFCRLLLFSHLRFVDSAAFVTMRRDAVRPNVSLFDASYFREKMLSVAYIRPFRSSYCFSFFNFRFVIFLSVFPFRFSCYSHDNALRHSINLSPLSLPVVRFSIPNGHYEIWKLQLWLTVFQM